MCVADREPLWGCARLPRCGVSLGCLWECLPDTLVGDEEITSVEDVRPVSAVVLSGSWCEGSVYQRSNCAL